MLEAEASEKSDTKAILQRADERTGQVQLAGLRLPISVTAVMQTGIFFLLLLAFLYFAQALVLPIVVAVLLNFLLAPIVRAATRMGMSRVVTAIILVLFLAFLALSTLYVFSGPAGHFIDDARSLLDEFQGRFSGAVDQVEDVREAARKLEEAATGAAETEVVTVRGPGILGTVLSYAQSLGAGVVAATILLIFLLCSDEVFLHKLVRVLPTFHDKRLAVEIFRQIERDISYYLITISVLNAALGIAAGFLFWLVGVPNPVMWGVMVGVLNFVPYLGPVLAAIVMGCVGLITFESLGMAAVAPLIVGVLNLVEANYLTPRALGHRLDLNPVMIFLTLAFWGFLWGIPGMALAVPLLVVLKTVSDHVAPLAPISEFLSKAEAEFDENTIDEKA